MEKIRIKDINFENLILLPYESSESQLFTDVNKKHLYKIYNDEISKKNKSINLYRLSNMEEIKGVIWPTHIITNGKKHEKEVVEGCIMPYKDNTTQLVNVFDHYNQDVFDKLMFDNSMILRNVHNSGLIIGDVSVYNSLFDKKLNSYICDFDSIKTDERNFSVSGLCMWYFRNREIEAVQINENFDRFSMLLNYLYMVFKRTPESISERLYDEKKEQIPVLNDMEEIVYYLKDRSINIPYIPYLDEMLTVDNEKIKKY